MSIAEKIALIAENEEKVYEAGEGAERARFWNAYQQNGNKRNYRNAFFNWPDEVYDPQYPIIITSQANDVFYYSKITDTKVDISTTTGMTRFFSSCSRLSTVRKMIVTENVTFSADCFYQCSALVSITFEGIIGNDISLADSPLLSRESILNIFSVLSQSAAGKTVSLSAKAVATAFGTPDAAEWVALISTRPNWSVTLI